MIPYLLNISKNNYQEFKVLKYSKTDKISKDAKTIKMNDLISNLNIPNSIQIDNNTGLQYCLIKLRNSKGSPNPIEVVGIVCYRHTKKLSKLIELEIFDQYRRLGYADKILRQIIRESISYGSKFISLFVFSHRTAAIRLYEKNNFVKVKIFDKGYTMINNFHLNDNNLLS